LSKTAAHRYIALSPVGRDISLRTPVFL